MNNIEVNLDRCKKNISLLVLYEYSYDPGVYVYKNGDPGYPSNEEIEIKSIQFINEDADLLSVLDYYNKCQDVIDEIEVKISEYEKNKR